MRGDRRQAAHAAQSVEEGSVEEGTGLHAERKDVGPKRMCVRRQAALATARVCRVIWHISDLDVIYVNNLTYIYIYVMSKFYRNNLIFF